MRATVFGATSSWEADGRTTAPRLGYQPALDGLRAIAVLAVIAYHDGYAWARGGFLGVDAFFVLSGFLITTLLVLEDQRTFTIDLLAFWGRRLRRLLPALLLVLLAVSVYSATEVASVQLNALRGDAISSLFYVANWRFIATGSSYFDLFAAPSPVRHLWSLAIEEQFYLVWPLVVLGCFKVFHGSRRALLAISLGGVAASTVVMAALYDSADPSRAYFGTDARIHTILVGAVLALILLAKSPRTTTAQWTVRIVGLAGAAWMVWSMHALSDQSSFFYRGGSLIFAVAVAALIAAAVQPAPTVLRSGLALPPLVWIGRISYGLYLWHWPVNVYLTEARVGFGSDRLNALRLLVTFGLATASYYLLELPIRRGSLRATWGRWVALAAIAVTGVALIAATAGATSLPSYLGGGGGAAAPATTPTTTPATTEPRVSSVDPQPVSVVSAGVDFRTGGAVASQGIVLCPPEPTSEEREGVREAVGDGSRPQAVPDGPVRVLVVGDSLGCSVAIGLGAGGAPAIVAHQATIVGCGVVSDQVFDQDEPFPRGTENCERITGELQRKAMESFRPDVVLWISTWERFNFVSGDQLLTTGSEPWKHEFQRRIAEGKARLTVNGARLMLVTVAPPAPASMINGGRIVSPRFDWKFPVMNRQLIRFAKTNPDTGLIDVAAKICPDGPPCPEQAGGIEPRHGDGVHFDPPGAVWLSRWMLPQILAAAGVPVAAPPL